MKPPLHIVTAADAPDAKPPTVAQHIQQLQAEAKQLARDHVRALAASMAQTQALAAEIAAGGAAYHHGSQEMAQRVADALESQGLTLQQIMERAQ